MTALRVSVASVIVVWAIGSPYTLLACLGYVVCFGVAAVILERLFNRTDQRR